jgi:hypothetical protein
MFARCLVVVLSAAQVGCAVTRADALCSVSASELEVLKQRALAFVGGQRKTSSVTCEQLYDTTANLRGHGCAIGGGPAIGQGCPNALDGDYVIVFDRATLQPKELLFVAH